MQYRPVYQTWRMHRGGAKRESVPAAEPQQHENRGGEEKDRHRIQKLRIEQRLSIGELARRIKVEPETLAAYERGDAILEAEVVAAMERVLVNAS